MKQKTTNNQKIIDELVETLDKAIDKRLEEGNIKLFSIDSFIAKADFGYIDIQDKTVVATYYKGEIVGHTEIKSDGTILTTLTTEDKELIEKIKQDKSPNFSVGVKQ